MKLLITHNKLMMMMVAIPFSLSVIAQEVDSVLTEQVNQEKDEGLETIMVTAQKRVSSLQETAIAISAFNEGLLEERDIEDALDIQFAIPNAMFARNEGYNIRGVGNNAISSSSDPGTGVHINGVYLTSNTIQNEYYDLQAIEVLRGPQGTLYGRNTTAGVVNAITKRPIDDFEFDMTAELASFDSLRTTGALNFVISDEISQRFAFNTVKREGYTENVAENVGFDELDGREQYSVRSTTAFQFSDDTQGILFIQKFAEDSDRMSRVGVLCTPDAELGCNPDSISNAYPDSGFTDGSLRAAVGFGSFFRPDFYNTNLDGSVRENPADIRKVRLDYQPITVQDELLVSFEVTHDFGEHVLTSITAWHDKDSYDFQDFDNADGADAFLFPVSYNIGPNQSLENTTRHTMVRHGEFEAQQKSQEIRLASYLPGSLNYTVGAFWLNYQSATKVDFYVPELGLLAQAIGVPEQFQPFSFDTPDFETSSWAVFGEGYYDVSDKLKLTLGLRYTEEEKEIVTRQISPLSFLNPAFDVNNSYNNDSGEWEEVTGKLGFSYHPDVDFTEDTFLFGTISRGYKGGGINPGASETSFPTFDPEYINAIEFGAKNRLMENRLQLNLTAFFYKYDGYQTAGILPDSTTFNTNVDAQVQGAELELVAAPIEGLKINFNYSMLDSEITEDFTTSPDIAQSSTSAAVNIKGNELPYAPESSMQFGIQYSHLLGDSHELTWRAQTYWQDDYWARLYNSITDRLDSWQQTDLNVGLRDINNTWEVELFVKNASDEASLSSLSTEGAFIGRFRQPQALNPRTYGVRFHYLFE